jgi:TRAP-type C4-dicarboxylate transport system substrate-binding protein
MAKSILSRATAVLAGGAFALAASAAGAEVQKVSLKAVGTWANLTNYYDYEKPFYQERLGKASGGKVKAQINPITELGLKGWEVMRLLKLGVFDVSHGVYGYVASEDPALEGVDLSSASKDFAESRKVVEAYEPVIAKRFDKVFGAKYLYTFRWPSQMIWCNAPVNSLADLKGKKIRVYSTTLGDFVNGVGGTSVTIAFAEVVPALQKGVADCGITGTMPAFQAKWHEVITHAMLLPVGAGLGFAAMSNKKWNALNGDTQSFFLDQYRKLGEEQWANAKAEDDEAFACLSGDSKWGKCTKGTPGTVKLLQPGPADLKARETILSDFVLKAWANRCSDECVSDWNATAASVVGVKAKK